MDPITHGFAGATIFNLGFKRKAAFWVLLLSSIAPDFDFITRFWGADVFLKYHRGISHGILALVVVPIIIGLIFGYKKGFFYYSFIACRVSGLFPTQFQVYSPPFFCVKL